MFRVKESNVQEFSMENGSNKKMRIQFGYQRPAKYFQLEPEMISHVKRSQVRIWKDRMGQKLSVAHRRTQRGTNRTKLNVEPLVSIKNYETQKGLYISVNEIIIREDRLKIKKWEKFQKVLEALKMFNELKA